MNVKKEVAALERLTVNYLRVNYAELYGESTDARHKQSLVRDTVWRMQALEEGDETTREPKLSRTCTISDLRYDGRS